MFISRPTIRTVRLDDNQLIFARNQRIKEIRMWSIVHESLVYFSLFSIIWILIIRTQHPHAFQQVKHLKTYFQKPNFDYKQIRTKFELWNWLETSFVTNIRAQQWYNGDNPRHLNGFINDKTNRMIGWPILRQSRIEDKRSFAPGWTNQSTINFHSRIRQAFEYQSDGYVYEIRGKLKEIQSNLSELHRLSWIDNRTRMIFVQLTLFNPNTNLFSSIEFIFECLSIGSIDSNVQFRTISFEIISSKLQLIGLILYFLIIIYIIFKQIRLLFQLKSSYLKHFWSYIELSLIFNSFIGILVQICRLREYRRIENLFKQAGEYVYIDLHYANHLTDLYSYVFGMSCFFATIKLISICQYNRRLSLFIRTLERCFKDLISFVMMFSIVYLAFISLFYLLFNSKFWSCSNLFRTMQMLFEMILLKFDGKELATVEPILGPICFSLFILLVVFVCMNMFLSIINDNFRLARENRDNDQDIFSFMFNKLFGSIGLKRLNQWEKYEIYDARMRQEYFQPVECFPEKIDQLFQALNRVCFCLNVLLKLIFLFKVYVNQHRVKKYEV